MHEKKQMILNERNKKIPADPYECWCMPCTECYYFTGDEDRCGHPEALPYNRPEK